MAEGNAFRIPAVFSADANLKPGPGLPPALDPDVDQFPNPVWQLAFSEGSVPGTRYVRVR